MPRTPFVVSTNSRHSYEPAVNSGTIAEQKAALYLTGQGYTIVDQNWRTSHCEIDIVASKEEAMYFFEVKYRVRDTQGSGLEYLTPAKLKQMEFAATMWINEHLWGGDYYISGIELSGDAFTVTGLLEDITP